MLGVFGTSRVLPKQLVLSIIEGNNSDMLWAILAYAFDDDLDLDCFETLTLF